MEWISVEDRFPETIDRFDDYDGEYKGSYSNYVVGYHEDYGWMKCFYDKDCGWKKDHSSLVFGEITHWIKIESPKGE